MEAINNLFNGTVTLESMWAWITGLYDSVKASADVANVLTTIEGYLAVLHPALIAGIFIALSLVVAFFGKKLLGLMKFLACFVIGYGVGVFYLTAPIQTVFADIQPWIIGLVVGFVAALLCAVIYFLVYFVGSAYVLFLLLYGGTVLPEVVSGIFAGNFVVSIAVAAGVAVVLLLLRKWIEMLGTAVLGGWLTYLSVGSLLTALMGYGFEGIEAIAPYLTIVMWVIIAVVALPAFAVQVRTRRRY